MRVLMIATNPGFLVRSGGTTVSRSKLISLLAKNNEVISLDALPSMPGDTNVSCINKNVSRAYYFRQMHLRGKYLTMFTDLNIGFLLKVKRIVKQENIDLICISEPYGIILTSLICPKTPLVYDAHDVVSELAIMVFQVLERDFKVARLPIVRNTYIPE